MRGGAFPHFLEPKLKIEGGRKQRTYITCVCVFSLSARGGRGARILLHLHNSTTLEYSVGHVDRNTRGTLSTDVRFMYFFATNPKRYGRG